MSLIKKQTLYNFQRQQFYRPNQNNMTRSKIKEEKIIKNAVENIIILVFEQFSSTFA